MVVGWGVVAAMAMGGEMMAAVVVTVEVATVAAVVVVVEVAAEAMVVAALAMTGTCSMAHRAPIPLAAPNTHGGIEGGYGTHDKSARDGVRGFEGICYPAPQRLTRVLDRAGRPIQVYI